MIIFTKLSEIDKSPPKLTLHDRNLLQDIVEILTPFAEATDFVQVGCVPSVGYVLPCIKGLQHHLKSMVSKYHSSFVIGLSLSLSNRMPYFEIKKAYIMAAILDPRFQLRWYTDGLEKQTFTDLVKSEVDAINTSCEHSSQSTSQGEEPPSKKTKSLFSFMPETEAPPAQISAHVSSVEEYLETP